MANLTNRSLQFSSCSLLMAALFAYSASVQLNDPDWYFWFPLYASAFLVNLLQLTAVRSNTINKIAKFGLWVGILLLLKVVVETYLDGLAGFWSLDLSKRVVREKIGSGLVLISMFLQLKASEILKDPMKRKRKEVGRWVKYGMALLVVVSYGVPLAFFGFWKGDLKL